MEVEVKSPLFMEIEVSINDFKKLCLIGFNLGSALNARGTCASFLEFWILSPYIFRIICMSYDM